MLRVVCDLNVVVSGLITPGGPPRRALRAALERRIGLVVCPRWVDEARAVTGRPEYRRYFAVAEADALIASALAVAERRADPAAAGALTRDPADDYLVALALESGCDAVVSGDKDLLALAGRPAVWTPRELLERLEHTAD